MILYILFSVSAKSFETALVGNTEVLGYYYTELWVGSEKNRQTVIVDTGSSLTAFPCINCKSCGSHFDSYFDYTKSSTFQILNCSSGTQCSSCSNNVCEYHQSYAEGSSISGILVKDYISLTLNNSFLVESIFGCHRRETNLFKSQRADGIMGLSRKKDSLIDKLFELSLIDENLFSICFGKDDGVLQVGKVNTSYHTSDTIWTRMYDNNFYSINLTGISVNELAVDLEKEDFSKIYSTGTIIDSGTTFVYFTAKIYNQVLEKFKGFCQEPGRCAAQTVKVSGEPNRCFVYNEKQSLSDFFEMFPSIKFEIEGGFVDWKPEFYLFSWPETPYYYCLGMYDNSKGANILGGIFMRGKNVIFNRNKMEIGFADSSCSSSNAYTRIVSPIIFESKLYSRFSIGLFAISTCAVFGLSFLVFLVVKKANIIDSHKVIVDK